MMIVQSGEQCRTITINNAFVALSEITADLDDDTAIRAHVDERTASDFHGSDQESWSGTSWVRARCH
jgi:hypothetical protein